MIWTNTFYLLFFTYLFSQENNTQQDSVLQSAEMGLDTTTETTPISNVDPDESVNQVLTSVPLGLDSGIKVLRGAVHPAQ